MSMKINENNQNQKKNKMASGIDYMIPFEDRELDKSLAYMLVYEEQCDPPPVIIII